MRAGAGVGTLLNRYVLAPGGIGTAATVGADLLDNTPQGHAIADLLAVPTFVGGRALLNPALLKAEGALGAIFGGAKAAVNDRNADMLHNVMLSAAGGDEASAQGMVKTFAQNMATAKAALLGQL